MPLIVPGLQSKDGQDDLSKWTNALVGKTIGSQSNETTFSKSDLPKNNRIIGPGDMHLTDQQSDRLTIHTSKDGIVEKVKFG